jgi:predicted negative regulator of RcsB-dependent stress response
MEIKVHNFLIKFIQTASLAVVLAVLIVLCSVLPNSNKWGTPDEPSDPVPVIAESGSYGATAEKTEYNEDKPTGDSEQPIDIITDTIAQTDVPDATINNGTPAPEKTEEAPAPAPVSVPAPVPAPTPTPAPVRTVVSVDNQVKPVAALNQGNITNSGRENSDSVIDGYTQEIQNNPNNAAAYHSRGFAYYNRGEYDRAIADFTQAIKIDPNNAVTYNNRGAAYNSKGNYDLAIADLDQAIRLNPDFENPYRHRAFACLKKGDYKQARDDVNNAMQINPGNQSAQDISAELKRLGY